MKHIVVISQYFYPESFRINELCTQWVKRGYQVTVVTGIPNYPQGKFYDGYGWRKRRTEIYNGVQILRLPLIPRGNRKVQLVLNYLSFVCAGWLWNVRTNVKSDCVFIFEVSPMTQALVGIWYAKKEKIPCYIYVQDLWPDNVETITGIHNKFVLRPINRMVDYIYKHCSHIFATSPSFVKDIQKRGIPEEKVSYWPQFAEDFYVKLEREKSCKSTKKKFCIIFTGNLGYAQGLDILPKTAELLRNEAIRFVIIGDGRYRTEFTQELERRNVKEMFCLLGQKKPEEISGFIAKADIAFLSFRNDPLFYKTIPAKLQSYMACGIPILAAVEGETKRIIEEAKCGVCTPIGDANQLADQIKSLKSSKCLEQMGQNALLYSRKHFNKDILLEEIDQYLQNRRL